MSMTLPVTEISAASGALQALAAECAAEGAVSEDGLMKLTSANNAGGHAQSLDHDWIKAHVPHQGTMCLLDRVTGWDTQQLLCYASSHRDPANPLRAFARLGAACGIEYAAQAMALHGALLAPLQATPRAGMLASVRSVQLHVQRLDDINAELAILVKRFSGDDNHVLYDFSITAAGVPLLDGRAAVILDAGDGLMTQSATPVSFAPAAVAAPAFDLSYSLKPTL